DRSRKKYTEPCGELSCVTSQFVKTMLVKNPPAYNRNSDSMKDQSKGQKTKTKVFLVDDHPLVRTGIAQLINKEPDMQVCGEAEDAPDALRGISATKPDLVTVDISLRGYNGIEL